MEDIKTLPKEINKIKIEPKIPEKITKIEKIEYGNFKLLLVFNVDLEVVELINFSNRLLKDNIYSENLFYVELEEELFFQIQNLIRTNKLKLSKNPVKEKIGIGDIIKTPLPPKPPTPEELTNKALLEQTMQIGSLTQKTQGLATGIMEGVINQSTLENKVNALSKALLEITMKGIE